MIMITRYTQKWVKIKSPGVVKIIISEQISYTA
jgi:hypothetical protein